MVIDNDHISQCTLQHYTVSADGCDNVIHVGKGKYHILVIHCSGQVVGDTAKNLSERFGKVLQKRQSMTISRQDKSTSISTQLDSLIPASKISNLTQGMFVGAVADNFDERIEQKIFHCEIVVDKEAVL